MIDLYKWGLIRHKGREEHSLKETLQMAVDFCDAEMGEGADDPWALKI